MFVKLPKPIADYVDARARRDVDGMVQPFAADAVVRDDGQQHQGRPAIRTWVQQATIAQPGALTPDTVCYETGRIVVEGVRTGVFEGSPRRFALAFDLEGDAIRTMEIV